VGNSWNCPEDPLKPGAESWGNAIVSAMLQGLQDHMIADLLIYTLMIHKLSSLGRETLGKKNIT
jgi:hypothetical protein